jgi:muramidase (phage lysozyme)
MNANITAFFATIGHSEGSDLAADQYRVCFAYKHTIVDLTYHPAEHRPDGSVEWHGEPLADNLCIAAGLNPVCISTAAGRYQITRPTWLRLKGLLRLSGFGPSAQDDCCVQLIKERGALDLVNAGRVADAIALCHPEWASFPGSTSGQPQKAIADLLACYTAAGGLCA